MALPSKPSQATSAPHRSETGAPEALAERFGGSDLVPIDFDHDDYAPSRQTLLRRAAELGPRMTMASIRFQSADPILGAKMQPRVIERRARLRRMVKVAVGACVGFCVIATVATAFSSTPASSASKGPNNVTHTPATSVEKLDTGDRTKAPSHVVATTRPARFAKRR